MSYLLNDLDLFDNYNIRAGHAPKSNIAMQGCFDMPKRIGITYKDWGDSDNVEPWVAAGEIMFAGRDIEFSGFMIGTVSILNTNLDAFYTAINAATEISTFKTPYNSASGYVKSVTPKYENGGCTVKMVFHEPVVTLTGSLPASGSSAYTIDSIPFSSFGLYLSKADKLYDLPENKEQFFTKYGQEGYQIVKRKHKTLEMNGFVVGSSLSDFISKVQSLYKVFSSSGTRSIVLNTITTVICFATEGFTIENVHYSNTGVIAKFYISLMIAREEAATSGYCDEATALFARMDEQPTVELKELINTVIEGLIDGGVFTLSDCLYVRGVHTSQAGTLNWIKNAHDSTLVNSPTFTAKVGFKGNGTTMYIDNNYNLSTQGSGTLTDASYFLGLGTLGSINARFINGAISAATQRYGVSLWTAANERGYVMAADSWNGNVNAEANKSFGYSKTGNSVQGYLDGVLTGAAATVTIATSIPNLSIYELCYNNLGSAALFYNGQIKWSAYGKYLTESQAGSLHTWMTYFFDNVGSTF